MKRTTGPVDHVYKPRGVCQQLFHERTDELVVAGPAGTGKSRACLEKMNLMCLLNPGMRALMVRKTHASLTATGLVTFQEKVAVEGLQHGVVRYFGGSGQRPAQYQYSNGSVIVVGGMDKATKIMSSEYDLIYVQEATELSENDWEALTTRLRNGKVSFQQLLADCNPDKPTHWLKARADKGACLMLNSQHQDNPLLYDNDGNRTPIGNSYLAKLEALTGVRKERLLHGRWSAADGLVYDNYDPAVHIIDRFHIPKDWTRYWSVDFGYTNPFVCQMWAEDRDGRLYLYREIYMSGRTVEQHAETVAKLVMKSPTKNSSGTWTGEWREPRPSRVVCDHDAENRAVFEHAVGVSTVNAHKQVTEGIQAMQKRLSPAADGKPRLFFMRDSLAERDVSLADKALPCQTVEEIAGYVWDQAGPDRLKEAPKKQDDHGMDAARYMVAERDLGRRPRYRSFTY